MGCQKSAQAIRAIRAFRKRAVIVCPKNVVDVWAGIPRLGIKGEIRTWWPLVNKENSVVRLEGTTLPRHVWRVWQADRARDGSIVGWKKVQQRTVDKLTAERAQLPLFEQSLGLEWRCSNCHASMPYAPKPPSTKRCPAGRPSDSTRIVVIHYDIIHAWWRFLTKVWGCDAVVFDELHHVQGERAIRTRAVKALAERCDVRIGLTGTPIDARPKEFFLTLSILSPGRYGEKFHGFGARYCAGFQEQVTMEKLVWKYPGKSNVDELRRRLQFNVLRRTKEQAGLNLPPKIREIVDIRIPAHASLGCNEAVFRSSRLARQALALSAQGKLPQIIEDARQLAVDGHKVVVFCHRRRLAEHISNALAAHEIPTAFVHGGVSQKQRQDRRHTFNGADGGFVFVCTYKTCATGISLTAADICLFAELSYEPKDMIQAESRPHRPGQTRTVICRYYIGRGSIDDLVARMIVDKFDTIQSLIGEAGDGLDKDLDTMPKGQAALDALYERWEAARKEEDAA